MLNAFNEYLTITYSRDVQLLSSQRRAMCVRAVPHPTQGAPLPQLSSLAAPTLWAMLPCPLGLGVRRKSWGKEEPPPAAAARGIGNRGRSKPGSCTLTAHGPHPGCHLDSYNIYENQGSRLSIHCRKMQSLILRRKTSL